MVEILSLRQENSKTFAVEGKKRQAVISMGAIHYKDNYVDSNEGWKDIDLTWEGNRITRAPYELIQDGKKITIRDKKSGEISSIELLSVFPAGMKFEIVPENTRVSFRHILPSDKIPFEATFKVTGKGHIATKAFDDDGELVLDTSVVGDILTEKLNEVRDKQTGQVRPAKGQIRVDPTWQVTASTDDCAISPVNSYFATGTAILQVGYADSTYVDYGCAARFLNITIPNAATIDSANLIMLGYSTRTNNSVNTRIRAELIADSVTFSDITDFNARTWTTALVNWDAIGGWVFNTEYTSPDIKTCIQEVVNLVGWASGNDIAILFDDFEQRSTASTSTNRQACSYDNLTTRAPKLSITYTVPGWAGGDPLGVAIAGVAKINGVALADIDKVNGVG